MVDFLFTLRDMRLTDQNEAEKTRQQALAVKQRPFKDEALATRKVLVFERQPKAAGKEQAP
jgi:cytochrome c peroxidase